MNAPMEEGKWYLFSVRGKRKHQHGMAYAIGAGHVQFWSLFATGCAACYDLHDVTPLYELPAAGPMETEYEWIVRAFKEAKPVVAPITVTLGRLTGPGPA